MSTIRVIRYAEDANGTNMADTPSSTRKFQGIGYMPTEVKENPNLIDNSDLRLGMTNWIKDVAYSNIVNGEMQMTSSPPTSLNRVYYNTTKNPFSLIQNGESLYYRISARSEDGSFLKIGQVATAVTAAISLPATSTEYSDSMIKNDSTTLSIAIDQNKTVYWKNIIVCKNPVDHYYQSPSDWISDPSNYEWTEMTPYTVYADTSDGTNMSTFPKPTSRYRGTTYMPSNVENEENLFKGTQKFVLDNNRINGWYLVEAGATYTSQPDIEDTNFNVAGFSRTGLSANNIAHISNAYIDVVQGDVFTLSFEFKVTDINVWDQRYVFIIELYNAAKNRIAYSDILYTFVSLDKPLTNDTWIKATRIIDTSNFPFSWTAGNNWSYVKTISIRLTLFRNGEIFFRKAKFERGNIATSWTPAPSEWLADPTNYTWEKIEYRYAKQISGVGKKSEPSSNITYMGQTFMPISLSAEEKKTWLADATKYNWSRCRVRYLDDLTGVPTQAPVQTTKYIGALFLDPAIYTERNLVSNSTFQNGAPALKILYVTTPIPTTITTTVEDGFTCQKVTVASSNSKSFQGVYFMADTRANEYIVVSFMIKGSVSWSSAQPRYERSDEISISNKKNFYSGWERVIWRGKKNAIGGAFSLYVNPDRDSNFFIRDLCIQKSDHYSQYKVPPQDYETTYFYQWYRANIKYSPYYDGFSPTDTATEQSKYIGMSVMPREIVEHENLLLNTDFKKVTGSTYGPIPVSFNMPLDGTLTSAVNENICSITKTSQITSARKVFNQNLQSETISAGTVMTFSLDILVDSSFQDTSKATTVSLREYKVDNTGNTESAKPIDTIVANTWTRLTCTKVILQDKVNRSLISCGIYFGTNVQGTISTRNWKLEVSGVATAWTPTPSEWLSDTTNYRWEQLNDKLPYWEPAKTDWLDTDSVRSIDLNRIEGNIARLQKVEIIPVRSQEFSSILPYTLEIAVPGLREDSLCSWKMLPMDLEHYTDLYQASIAYSCVDAIIPKKDALQLLCFTKKPEHDFYLYRKGV